MADDVQNTAVNCVVMRCLFALLYTLITTATSFTARSGRSSALATNMGVGVCSISCGNPPLPSIYTRLWMVKGSNDKADQQEKKYKKGNLPVKICECCNRPMEWRKSWAKNWNEVKYCSEKCRRSKKSAPIASSSP